MLTNGKEKPLRFSHGAPQLPPEQVKEVKCRCGGNVFNLVNQVFFRYDAFNHNDVYLVPQGITLVCMNLECNGLLVRTKDGNWITEHPEEEEEEDDA